MNILIDIGHPAHVHLYRNFIREMEGRGHRFWITVKNVSASKKLLELYQIPFIEIGDKSDSIFGKAVNQLKYDYILHRLVKKNKIDVCMGTSITIAHISKFSRVNSVVFDDDDDQVEPLFTYFAHPFIDYLLSPDVLQNKRKKKNSMYYAGYHELAYLHPKRFSPDFRVLDEIGLKPGDCFFVLRFNAFKAHHDKDVMGLSLEDKRQLINDLLINGKVLITMERELEPEFEKYRMKISPEKIHSLLYYATMFVGDSMTMSSEAAILGTPALKCHSFSGILSVPNELEKKYQLCFSYQPNEVNNLFKKIEELLSEQDLKLIWQERISRMLQNKIDVTSFMVWFVENLPNSADVMRSNPQYHLKFR